MSNSSHNIKPITKVKNIKTRKVSVTTKQRI